MASSPATASRSDLAKTASRYRTFAAILSWLDRYLSWPLPPQPLFELFIPSTVSRIPGSIPLYFFTASNRPLYRVDEEQPEPLRPVLINFHGGGFSIGHALDDARWIGAVLKAHPDAVVISVDYRLAPEHPFPVPIEDGVDAVMWLWEHAAQYSLDRARFALSGASAGGNLAFTVPLRLHEELTNRAQRQGKAVAIGLAGIVAFYPSTDWSRTRSERDATNPIAPQKSMISPSLYAFFDESYLLPKALPKKPGSEEIDMAHPYLSPGLATACLLEASCPANVAIYTCGWDQLLAEGNAFRERLRQLRGGEDEEGGGHVGGMTMEGTIHGFDKKPSFCLGNRKRDQMYGDAVAQLDIMWREGALLSSHSSSRSE
ncbi:hypothetical protein N7462_010728 [Penicillium macrosclerotiorum]|uniref:uncharacterized protein n=1 Tax=Penicillium macrosclerotiorum TaxID=303699 RepID=UPI002546DA31|nr:uncharacterized protein N7462_010728 [Penicillium macrosclerotiorum]KAJ5669658.1 hypothetical protein N7462_010728 [Penicillium macrosclerotiorum]